MPEEKLGIENIKKAFTEIIDTTEVVVDRLEDGFQWWSDSFALAKELNDLPIIITTGRVALSEFGDLDPQESKELANFFAEEFDIAQDDLEAKIEEGVKLLAETYEFGNMAFNKGTDLYTRWKDWRNSLRAA